MKWTDERRGSRNYCLLRPCLASFAAESAFSLCPCHHQPTAFAYATPGVCDAGVHAVICIRRTGRRENRAEVWSAGAGCWRSAGASVCDLTALESDSLDIPLASYYRSVSSVRRRGKGHRHHSLKSTGLPGCSWLLASWIAAIDRQLFRTAY